MNIRMTKRWGTQHWLALISLAMLFWLGAPLSGQNTIPQTSDSDVTQRQVEGFDRFLDSHPEIAEQLRRDPSLVNNQEFVENHPALQDYLQTHPGIREELSENPQAFMKQERRFERSEMAREGVSGDNDRNRSEIAAMDNFLDNHPEIAEQLRRDPSLINNKHFVDDHPELRDYLQRHPEIREEFSANPQAFMHQEQRFEQREGKRGQVVDNDDMNRRQIAGMDNFLDSHPEIAEQLRKDPSLIRNDEFVNRHPELKEYLQQHPEIRNEFSENPQAFMRREERFDQHEEGSMRAGDRDSMHAEASRFGQFLGSHSAIGQEIANDPSLVNNKEYLESHGELREYLQTHPLVKQELTENPQAFMNAVQQSGNSMPAKASTPKAKKQH